MSKPQKIFLLGIQGAGKTTLVKQLNLNLKLPAYYLDSMTFDSDWKLKSNENIKRGFIEIVNKDKWILDGFYSECADVICPNADLCIYIASGRLRSYFNIFKRRLKSIRNDRIGTPEGSNNKVYFSLLKKVWKKNKKDRTLYFKELQFQYSSLEYITLKRINRKTILEIIDSLKAE